MTNEQKIKAYLAAGHHVKIITKYDTIIVTSYAKGKFSYYYEGKTCSNDWEKESCFERYTIEPLPLTPPQYKVGDKVIILDVAKQVADYAEWDQEKKDMIGKVFTIYVIDYCINIGLYSFPYWAVAPYFDDKEEAKQTKIQELETQLSQIAKELELLKK